MLRVGVLVSGGGTNLQAILDAIDAGTIRNAKVEVVISNNAGAFALERAKKHGIPAECLSPKDFASREEFNEALVAKIDSYERAGETGGLSAWQLVLPVQNAKQQIKELSNKSGFLDGKPLSL